MAESEKFNPSKPGTLRALHGPRWQLEQDFAQPTLDMLESGRNLRKFEDEEAPDYEYRKYMSCPLDMIPDALTIRQDNIFRELPVRHFEKSKYKELIETLISDADGDGTPLNEFMRRALWQRNAIGVDIVTQMTSADVEVVSVQDAKDAGLRPFWLQFSSRQKVDWATKGSGIYRWVRYSLGAMPSPSEKRPAPGVMQFLTLTPETWQKWAQKIGETKESDPEVVDLGTGENWNSSIQAIVPAIKFYFAESMVPGEGGVSLSLITRAAVIARCALNLKSQADMDMLAAVARWLLKGIGSDKAPNSMGPQMLWATENADADLSVVQGSADPLKEKRVWLELFLGEILRLLKFRGGMGEVEGNQGSGVKLALEMTDLRNELTSTASEMEALELEMMRQAVVMATGDDIPQGKEAAKLLGYRVKYNKQFVLDSAAELLDYMKAWFVDLDAVSTNLPAMNKALLERFANLLVRNDDPDAENVAGEIDTVAGSLDAEDE